MSANLLVAVAILEINLEHLACCLVEENAVRNRVTTAMKDNKPT